MIIIADVMRATNPRQSTTRLQLTTSGKQNLEGRQRTITYDNNV